MGLCRMLAARQADEDNVTPQMMAETYANLVLLGLVFVFFCWVFLPLGILRLNSLVKQLLREQRKTNELLRTRQDR